MKPDSTPSTAIERVLPPYIAASTFLSTIDGWRAVRPSRIDRTVLSKVAGSVQTWLIAALRYFDLIDNESVPTDKLHALAESTGQQRAHLIAVMLREHYPFLFARGINLANITQSQLKEKFEATGAKGDTAVKAMSFFTAMAKLGGIELSPYVTTRQRRPSNGRKSAKKPGHGRQVSPDVARPATVLGSKTNMQVLIEMLNLDDMDKDEQAAVWTLIRYLKKAGS